MMPPLGPLISNMLYTNLGGYSELSCIMAAVCNLEAKLGGYFMYFHNDSGG